MTSRRSFLATLGAGAARGAATHRPNILFAIADDQSWAHTSFAGCKTVRTPAFDRVARTGVYFRNAVSASPGCAPSRAAILTGRTPWQLEEAGTHASLFPRKLQVFPELLQKAGYHVGLTGKGAGPCNWESAGWPHNPAGPDFQTRRLAKPAKGIGGNDYAANFADFLATRHSGKPFCFWFGANEPHRVYEPGAGIRAGKVPADVKVPPFLPDAPEVRSDILDYCNEIEHFDRHLGRMLDLLEQSGELADTIVVVTADNGMSFPGSKATMHEYGIHMPLAIAWPAQAKGGRVVDDMVSFTDFAPTFLQAAGAPAPAAMTGRSLVDVLRGGGSGLVDPQRTHALSGRERHSHARADNLGYPARALRTRRFLYIRNFAPDRWPAGDPDKYFDIDNGPTKTYMMENRKKHARLFAACFGKQPAEELYDIVADPGCLRNLAAAPAHAATRAELRATLDKQLTAQRDPRMSGKPDIWESYPRFSAMRPELGGFAAEGEYNPKYR